jgi:hypothetical protein
MAGMAVGDSTLESLTPNMNAPNSGLLHISEDLIIIV